MSDPYSTDPVPSVNPPPSGLIARVIAILTKPSPTWDGIAGESSSVQSIYMGYVIPLAAIGPICHAIGMSVFGVGAFGIVVHTPLLASLVGAIVSYIISLVMIYVVAFIINALAPNFKGEQNMLAAFKLAVYSSTAGWIGGIFGLMPMLSILALLLALYGVYIMYVGLPKLMKSPPENTVVYMIVIAVVMIVMSLVVGAVAGVGGMLTGGYGAAGLGAYHAGAFGAANPANNTTFTVNGPNGKASVNLGQMEAAANQMAAQASAMQAGASAGAVVKTADPQALLNLMPASYMGAARSNTGTSSNAVGGIAASTATATYSLPGGGSIELKVVDTGTMAGLGAMAAAMNVNTSSSSATGYEVIKTEGGRMTTESYDTAEKSGKYAVLMNGRVSVEADGSNVDINAIRSLVNSVDMGKAQSLTQ